MIKIDHVEVVGWEHSMRGMRNPKNSWNKSDSRWDVKLADDIKDTEIDYVLGENDTRLSKQLRDGGSVHAKYRRMITVYADITAPLYWWKEFDTYKVGTVANSCSTMHKLCSNPITDDDFSIDDGSLYYMFDSIIACERLRVKYLETKNTRYWRALIQLLPSSYNQKRTVMLNYEVLSNIYYWRKNHKLDEWVDFCKWIETLPNSFIITGE